MCTEEIVVRVRVHISSAWAAFLGEKNMTVRELVNKISEKTGVTPLPEEKTCDHLMTGS